MITSIKKAYSAPSQISLAAHSFAFVLVSIFWIPGKASVSQENPPLLTGPNITKLDWNTRAPRFADIDGDGKPDIALINNGLSKIEFLIQNSDKTKRRTIGDPTSKEKWDPELEDGWFDKRFMVLEQSAYDMALSDFNDDGRIDMVLTGNRDALSIYLQDKDGEFEQSWTFDEYSPKQRGQTIRVSDINSDGEPDILAIGTDKILIFIKSKKSLDFEITEYFVEENAAWNLQVPDLNEDGLADLLYFHSNQSSQFLAARLQTENGQFGPEIPVEFNTSIFEPLPKQESEKTRFIYSEGRTRQVKTFSMGKEILKDGDPFKDIQAYTYPLNSTIRNSSLYTWGDLNGDKRTDLIIGDSEGAQIQVFLQDKSGLFATQKNFPSFAFLDGVSILNHPDTRKPVIFQVSQKERLVGISQMTKEGDLPFPTLLSLEGEPIAILNDHEASRAFRGLLLIEKIKRDYHLTEYTLNDDDEWTTARVKIEELKNEPRGFSVAYLEKETPFLVILAQREGAIFMKRGEDGWEETAKDAALRKTLLYDLAADRINFSDMDGNGIDELFVADTGFLRRIVYDAEKEDFVIEEQFNTPKRKQDAHLPIPYKRDGIQGIVYFDPKDDHIYWTGKSSVSSLQGNNQKEIPPLTPVIGRHIDMGKGNSALLLGGEKRFYLIPDAGDRWKIDIQNAFYEPETEEVRYAYLFVTNRLNDGNTQIVGIDPQLHVLELFSRTPKNEYSQLLEFTLFDQTAQRGNNQINYQPRDAGVYDLDRDGRDDIILLIHDRLLVYH